VLPAALDMFSPYADVRSRGDMMRTMIGIDPALPGAADFTGMPLGASLNLVAVLTHMLDTGSPPRC
jgi:hypothetical protein